ncbi:MAG: hypothetical protein IKL41_04705 [Clostridia bacterium]|nr:hypothetical protein [Clostridia bacterium]
MKIENKSLREAYALLENAAPLGYADCGLACGAVCCTDKTGDSMELFPHEKEIFSSLDGFEVVDGEVPLVKCNGSCSREQRPLACRIYPLFPLVVNEDGEDKIRVIYDPRASHACPLASERVRLDRRFLRAVRRAGKYLLKDNETAEYLKKTSEFLKELIELEIKLGL